MVSKFPSSRKTNIISVTYIFLFRIAQEDHNHNDYDTNDTDDYANDHSYVGTW